jgi:hypothetical protein
LFFVFPGIRGGKSAEAPIDIDLLALGFCGGNILDGRQHRASGRRVQAKAWLDGTFRQQMGIPD